MNISHGEESIEDWKCRISLKIPIGRSIEMRAISSIEPPIGRNFHRIGEFQIETD